MTDTSRGLPERPMSPHLQVWRWHITMACSILHRGCIIGLWVGAGCLGLTLFKKRKAMLDKLFRRQPRPSEV